MTESDRVIGVGLDLADVPRFRRILGSHGRRFAERVLRASERRRWEDGGRRAESIALTFAAKEACLKALGTGWALGLSFRDIEVIEADGSPSSLRLHGPARDRAERLGVRRIVLSEASGGELAAAVVVVLGGDSAGQTSGSRSSMTP